ncbi:MAG: hypothetical protein Q9223_006168 [Gallowayella weberi]
MPSWYTKMDLKKRANLSREHSALSSTASERSNGGLRTTQHQHKNKRTEMDDGDGENTRPDGSPNSKDNILSGLQMEKVMIDASIVDLQNSIDKATELGLVNNASAELVALQKILQADVMTLKDDLECYKDIDPLETDKKRKATAVMRKKAELWTNNVELLEGWLGRALGAEPAQLDLLRREFYGSEYLDGEGLKGL